MQVIKNPKIRKAIYVGNVLLAPVVAYALYRGWIGSAEMTLWGAEVTAALGLAGLNTDTTE